MRKVAFPRMSTVMWPSPEWGYYYSIGMRSPPHLGVCGPCDDRL